jgi:hypothetical protein
MMKRFLTISCLAGALAIAMVWGCAKEENLALPNTPPETYIAVGDSIRNPTAYIQEINWWGDDIDGEVIGFEYRWFQDPAEPGCPMDTGWVFTAEKSHEFHLPVTQGIVRSHRLEVRAMDDDRAVDRTQCKLKVPVTNTPPVVELRDANDLPDTTYPAIMVKWDASDAEGRETIDLFKVWLDGNEENARLVSGDDSTAAFGLEDFESRYGERTLYLLAMDTGCDSSSIVTHTWYVQEPLGDALLVDDLWSSAGAVERATDAAYRGLMDSYFGTYTRLDLEAYGGVTYVHNYEALFKMFDFVLWYDDPVRSVSETLEFARDGMREYVQEGGRFMLVSLTALGPNGAFFDSTYLNVLGADSLFSRHPTEGVTVYDFDSKKSWRILGNEAAGLDSLKLQLSLKGTKCMDKAETATAIYHIPPGTADSIQDEDYYLAIMNEWGFGKAAVFTFAFSRSNGFLNLENEFYTIVDLMLD